eukprot:Hpha_TRINITY_DN19095_c0_g1::TRINITY_DN19095_c0_g1_i1::g.138413::m.138413
MEGLRPPPGARRRLRGGPSLAQLLEGTPTTQPKPGLLSSDVFLRVGLDKKKKKRVPRHSHDQLVERLRKLRRVRLRQPTSPVHAARATSPDLDLETTAGNYIWLKGRWTRRPPSPEETSLSPLSVKSPVRQKSARLRGVVAAKGERPAAKGGGKQTPEDTPDGISLSSGSAGSFSSEDDAPAANDHPPPLNLMTPAVAGPATPGRDTPAAEKAETCITARSRTAPSQPPKTLGGTSPPVASPKRKVRAFCTERTYKDLVASFEGIDGDHGGTLDFAELEGWVRTGRMGRRAAHRVMQMGENGKEGELTWPDVLKFFFPKASDAQVVYCTTRWGWPRGADPNVVKKVDHWTKNVSPYALLAGLEVWTCISVPREGVNPPAVFNIAESDLATPDLRAEVAEEAASIWAGIPLESFATLIGTKLDLPESARRKSTVRGTGFKARRRSVAQVFNEQGQKHVWPPSPRTLETLFSSHDGDGDGYLSLQDILPMVAMTPLPLRELLDYDPESATADRSKLMDGRMPPPEHKDNIWLSHAKRWLYDDEHPPPPRH